MTDRPILFSAPMVRALLAGTKTQTRRALSRSWPVLGSSWAHKSAPWDGLDFGRAVARTQNTLAIRLFGDEAWADPHLDVPFLHPDDAARGQRWEDDQCRYRVRPPFDRGDHLYVREDYYQRGHWWEDINDLTKKGGKPKWKFIPADHEISFVTPANFLKARSRANPSEIMTYKRLGRFMPRRYSRITLTITDVRVEHLQDISEADAIAEGCEPLSHPMGRADLLWHEIGADQWQSPTRWYRGLWDSINGEGSWQANPWVVAITFDVQRGNVDA